MRSRSESDGEAAPKEAEKEKGNWRRQEEKEIEDQARRDINNVMAIFSSREKRRMRGKA